MLDFLFTCGNLKRVKRTGWLNNGIKEAESISDHMHRMSILAMSIRDPLVEKNKLIKMAIVHDLAEAVAGDITPNEGISKEAKFKMEFDGIQLFKEQLYESSFALEIESLWLEYEEGTSLEARVCKDLDKFEMILQAFEYEKGTLSFTLDGYGPLDDFFNSTAGKFFHPEIISLCDELYKARKVLQERKI